MKKPVDTAAELQELRKIPANKKCFDCNQAGTTYAAPELGIFLCSICGGIHREFSHRVKGLSTCNFSEVEVNKLKAAGNEKAALSWMARHDSRSFPIPDVKDSKKLKDFLRMKYLDKRFFENREVKQVEDRTENKVEEKKVVRKTSGSVNLLDDEPPVNLNGANGTSSASVGASNGVNVLTTNNSTGVPSNLNSNPGFNPFSNGFNAFNILNQPLVPTPSVPNTLNVPNTSNVPNSQNLFGFAQPGNSSANFQPFPNFSPQIYPNGTLGSGLTPSTNPFPANVQFTQPVQTSNLFTSPGVFPNQGVPNPQVINSNPGFPLMTSGPSLVTATNPSNPTNMTSGNPHKHFDPFDIPSSSGIVQPGNLTQASKDLFDSFNPFGNSAPVNPSPAGVSAHSNNFTGFANLSGVNHGTGHNVPGLTPGSAFFGSSAGNGANFPTFGAGGSMNNAGPNGNLNTLAFNGNTGSSAGSNFNPFGLNPGQNANPGNFVAPMTGFVTNPINPTPTFDAFKINSQSGPSNKFAGGPNHFSSKSSDPFEQIMEEQLEKGLTSNSNNPFGNTPQNSLVQKYNQIVETYQRSYGMPFPYSFHEWKNMNPSSSSESEVKQPRENPFDLYG